jgi:hypothetical protein
LVDEVLRGRDPRTVDWYVQPALLAETLAADRIGELVELLERLLTAPFRTGKTITVGFGLVVRSANGVGSRFRATTNHMEDAAHGPNGPRNAVYHCDLLSERDGLWMGGMNQNWLILHNRFVVERGRAFSPKPQVSTT